MKDAPLQELSRDELLALAKQLLDRVAEQDRRIAALEAELARSRKDSSNSSKPPSSDIVKPPADQGRSRGPRGQRRIGGQEGHPKHESGLTLDDADHVVDLHADRALQDPSRELVPAPDQESKVLFQYEFAERPVELTAYVSLPYRDRRTGEIVYGGENGDILLFPSTPWPRQAPAPVRRRQPMPALYRPGEDYQAPWTPPPVDSPPRAIRLSLGR